MKQGEKEEILNKLMVLRNELLKLQTLLDNVLIWVSNLERAVKEMPIEGEK